MFTHREGPHSTSHLTAWHARRVCHRKYLSGWREETETAIEENLPFVLWRIPRRRGKETGEGGDEGGKIYLRKKKKKKSAGSSEGRHGKILFHARQRRRAPRELRRCKNKAEREAQGVTWNRWNSEGRKEQPCGISGLFSLILNRPAQRERGRGSEVSDRLFDGAHVGCITSLPLLQCLMAILHILDSAMVGHGIVSLGGFFTMCRVRVSRPHL